MPRIIAAIIDTVANDIVGPIQAFRHPAQAIRFFSDVASEPNTIVSKHIQDYVLTQFAHLEDDLTMTPHREVIITGDQWFNAQRKHEEKDSLSLHQEK